MPFCIFLVVCKCVFYNFVENYNFKWSNYKKLQVEKNVREIELSEAKAYIMENIQSVSLDEVSRLLGTLPEWRKSKALAIKNEHVRRESILSFALLMRALKNEFGITSTFDVTYMEHGKPVFVSRPDIHFNISHCRNAVACVVGFHNVGIDIERRGRYNETTARYVLNEEEFRSVQVSADTDLAFTVLWTKKEALLKMIGVGVSCDMKNALRSHHLCKFSTFVNAENVCSVAIQK